MEPISRDDSPAAGKSGRAKKATRRKILIAAAVVIVIAIGIAAVPKSGGDNSARSGSLYDDAITTTCGLATWLSMDSKAKVVWTSSLNTGIASVRFNFTGTDGPTSPWGNAETVNGNKVFSASYEFGAKSVQVQMYTQAGQLVRTTSANC
ncbi:MAG: hypothetical protein F2894_05700 [Actinobacteria bacterium]|uniref:Unannotated protein n=1 Tax=freshwater metagenome TaxID=449393 RepID=A0A6J7QUU2_9ZZZZ|nr:hypothetical protein [Actinomycetota bacterium]MSX81671.1 hypothetical protein [Actinomycetota bacterium]